MKTQTVSEEVEKAAIKWANENTDDHFGYIAAVAAFIAGAKFMKPIEHEKLPDNGTGNS